MGTDSLTVYGNLDSTPQISNIENIVLDNFADTKAAALGTVAGVKTVTVSNAVGAATVTVNDGVAVTLQSNADATKAQTVNFGANDTAANLTLSTFKGNTGVALNVTGTKVATLNVTTTGGKANTVGTLNGDAALTTLNVFGHDDLTITDALEVTVAKVNAAEFTGKLSVKSTNNTGTQNALTGTVDVTDLTITGGAGNDTIDVSANAADNEITVAAGAGDDKLVIKTGVSYTAATATNAGDSFKGGTGTDTLSIDGNVEAADLSAVISEFDVLEFTAAAGGTDMSVNKLGINAFRLTGATTDVVLTGLAANATATIADDGADLTASIGVDTSADTLNVVLESNGTATGAALTANNYDTVTVSSSKLATEAATTANRLASVTAAAASKLTITGAQDLTITTAGLKAGATVDASAATGALTSTFTSSVKSYVGSAGVDTLVLAAGDLKQGNTFAGGAGNDTLTVTASASQDLGIVGLTGFEKVALTTSGANVADLRNVTDLTTLTVTAGAGTDDLTVNRISGTTSLTFASSIDQVITTVNTGTSQAVGVSAASTITSLTLDSGTTTLTITSDDGDATTAETMGTFSAISGTSLTSIIVKGADDTNLSTLSTTVTSVDASAATGNLTVTASATATSIIGSQVADSITGGGAADIIRGGKGGDTLAGGAGADTYVFEATGALNGADVFGANIVGGASGDILDFSAFLSGGSLLSATATEFNGTANTAIAGKLAFLASTNAGVAEVDTAAEVAALIQGAGNAFELASGGKAIIIAGDDSAATAGATIYFVDDTLDGVSGTVSANDVVIVGTATLDIDTILAANLKF